MPDRYQESHLRRVPLFKNLSDYELSLVGQASVVRRYNQGDFIFRQGEPTRGLHVFIDGQAVLFRALPTGQREQLGVYQNGSFINDTALFQQGTQTAYLQAVQPVTAILLTRENMADLLSHHPEIRPSLGLQGGQEQHLHAVHFKTQRENEEVLLSTRRHWWAYIQYMWLPLVIAIPFWVMIFIAPVIAPVVAPISLVLVIGMGAYLYFEWANDSVTITDQRVVRITHTILTFREVRDEIAIESIQEANAEVPALDPFAWLFRYGQVELKTAGKEGNFVLDFMPNPDGIQALIMEGNKLRKEMKSFREREAMRADLDRWINTDYQAGQTAEVEKPKAENAAKQKKIEDFWTEGDGPLSPFVSKFPTDKGGTVYRKHWSVWLKAVVLPALWIVAGLAILFLSAAIPFLRDFGVISFAASMVMLLFGALWFYYSDWDWRHDYYIVTDDNIIIVDQRPLWLKNENEQLLLGQVDNVAAETKGIWQRILRYGDVRVSLVGADAPKIFDNIADPIDVQSEITRRQARIKQKQAAQQQQSQREIIGEYLSLYHETTGTNLNPDYIPPDYAPRAAELRDRTRPGIVPQQNPPQPSMSEGRPYEAQDPYGYDGQGYNQQQYPAAQPYQQPNMNPPLPYNTSQQPYQQDGYNQQQAYQQGNYGQQQPAHQNPPLPQDNYSQQPETYNQQQPYQQGNYGQQQASNQNPPLPQDNYSQQPEAYNQQQGYQQGDYGQQPAHQNPPLPQDNYSQQPGTYNQQQGYQQGNYSQQQASNQNPPLPRQNTYPQQPPNHNPPLPPMGNSSQGNYGQQASNQIPPQPPEYPDHSPPPPPNLNPPPPRFNRGRNNP